MNITIIGHVCIDENKVEQASYKASGSPAMFMTKIFREFPKTSVRIISHRGIDFIDYEENIRISPKKPIFKRTLIYKNIVKNGHRTQFALNRESSPPVEFRNEFHELIKETDILIVAPILNNFDVDFVESFLEQTKSKCLKILSPQGYFRKFDSNNKVIFREFKESSEILPLFDFTILSDEDYPNILERAGEWSKNYHSNIIVTRGENGASLYENGSRENIETKPVKDIVDSTGSGDIFTASFAYKYLKKSDTNVSIEYANRVSGKCLGYNSESIGRAGFNSL